MQERSAFSCASDLVSVSGALGVTKVVGLSGLQEKSKLNTLFRLRYVLGRCRRRCVVGPVDPHLINSWQRNNATVV